MPLSRPTTSPALSIPTPGLAGSRYGRRSVSAIPTRNILNHRYQSFASVAEDEPGEAIRLSIEISFQARDDSGDYDLGSTRYVGVYRRDPGQKKFSLRSAGALPNRQFEGLRGRISFEDEEVLFYMMDRFKRIASGPATPEKRWLKKFVAGCKDTPEKRSLQTLLR